MGNWCFKESKWQTKINRDMNEFFFRFMKLEYIMRKINEFNDKKEKNYFTFWELTKLCGINSNLSFQNKYWELVYVRNGKESITGVLFIFILLSIGKNDLKLLYLKHYLSKYVNKSKDESKKLIMNLNDFESILKTYFSCLTLIAFETCDFFENFKKDKSYGFCEENISHYTTFVLKNYVKKNYYVNVEDFLENNLELLQNDKRIRSEIVCFKQAKLNVLSKIDYVSFDEKSDDNQPLTLKLESKFKIEK